MEQFRNRFLIYIILSLIPVIYRYQWNGDGVFISSDPQIKFYQVKQSLEGVTPAECFFPANKLGFPIKMIPFGYPWAFQLENGKCVFQYPVFFTYIQYPFAKLFGLNLVSYISILFFFLNIVILDRLLILLGLRGGFVLSFVVIAQFLSPIFLSSLDYSEVTLNNFFFLLSVFLIIQVFGTQKKYNIVLLGLILPLFLLLRPEGLIALLIFGIGYFLIHKNYRENFLSFLFVGLIALLFASLIFYMNFKSYGHILGMRGVTTLADATGGLTKDYWGGWIADIWGSKFKIGIFKGYPILLLFPIFLFQNNSKISKVFILSGLVFVIGLPFLSPYRAGVDVFGMRYFETGIYLIFIGFALCNFANKNLFYVSILALLITFYFSYKTDSRAVKIWSSSSKLYHKLQKEFEKVNPDLIVHRGLSLSYLVGQSYLLYPQVAIYSNRDWLDVELVAKKQNLKKILYLEWKDNQLVNDEFPKAIWDTLFNIHFAVRAQEYKLVSEREILHFHGKVFLKD